MENVKKCKNFLSTLIKLASSGKQSTETAANVKELVQNLLVRARTPAPALERSTWLLGGLLGWRLQSGPLCPCPDTFAPGFLEPRCWTALPASPFPRQSLGMLATQEPCEFTKEMAGVLRAFPLTPLRLPWRILSDTEAEGRVRGACWPAAGLAGPEFLSGFESTVPVLLPTAPPQSHSWT